MSLDYLKINVKYYGRWNCHAQINKKYWLSSKTGKWLSSILSLIVSSVLSDFKSALEFDLKFDLKPDLKLVLMINNPALSSNRAIFHFFTFFRRVVTLFEDLFHIKVSLKMLIHKKNSKYLLPSTSQGPVIIFIGFLC